MTEQSVHDALQDLADEAPTFRAIPTATVVKHINRSRTRRAALMGGTTLAVVAAIVGTVVVGIRWFDGSPAPDKPSAPQRYVGGGCGERLEAVGELITPLHVTLAFPKEVNLADGALLNGTATFTNVSDERVKVLHGFQVVGQLTRSGYVANTNVPQRAVGILLDLKPGESDTVDALVSLQRCDIRHAEIPWKDRKADLPPGVYQIILVDKFPREAGGTENKVEVSSEPATITLR